jgi:O-antigen/teichoic acid export membrane protein
LYAIGNGIMALGALPFYLLFARGMLRLHLVGSVLFAVAYIPLCLWGAVTKGPTGTGLALIVVSAAYLILWVPKIHSGFDPGLHRRWLLADILPVVAHAALAVLFMRLLTPVSTDRIQLGLQLAVLSAAALLAAASGSARARRCLIARVRRALGRDVVR